MDEQITPIFIPGLICTPDLFREQIAALDAFAAQHDRFVAPLIADTLSHDSITGMAEAALAQTSGTLIAIGLSMGGYIAQEMAHLAPHRIAGMALLSTSYKADDEAKQKQRRATIKMAHSDRFRGVTRHLLDSFLSAPALADEALVERVMQMAQDVGRHAFINQQTAILSRRDQRDTLRGFAGEALVLCGVEDSLTPPHLSTEMAAMIPQSDLLLLPKVGHLSSLEAPQAVSDALLALLGRVAAR